MGVLKQRASCSLHLHIIQPLTNNMRSLWSSKQHWDPLRPYSFSNLIAQSPSVFTGLKIALVGQIIFTVLALLSFALGSVLLSLVWFGIGVTTTGKDFGAATEGRAFAFILLWPATMLAVWIFSTLVLILAKRWLLASFSLPVAFAILYNIWLLSAVYFGCLFCVAVLLLSRVTNRMPPCKKIPIALQNFFMHNGVQSESSLRLSISACF